MGRMREILKAVDPNYMEEEEKYRSAAAALERETGGSIIPSVSDYLAAEEEVFADEIIYIGWQGFQLNLDIFNDPVKAIMLEMDDEELHRERRLAALTAPWKARQTIRAFRAAAQTLPGDQQALLESVTGFYAYLETVGFKLAHYFGFRLADHFLPYVIPGYSGDPVVTYRYRERLCFCTGIDAVHLG